MDGESEPRPSLEEEPMEATPSSEQTTPLDGAQETVATATGEIPRAVSDNDDDVVLVEEAPASPVATPTPSDAPVLVIADSTQPASTRTDAMETATAASPNPSNAAPKAPTEPIVIDDEEDPGHRDSSASVEPTPAGLAEGGTAGLLSSTEPDSEIKIASVTTLGPTPAEGSVTTAPAPEAEGDMNLRITSVTSLQAGGEGLENGLQISSTFSLSTEGAGARSPASFNPGRAGTANQPVQNGETGTHQRPDSWISQSATFPRNQKQTGVDSASPAASLPKPPGPAPSGSQPRVVKVTCANCKKPLRKGQTAYQRKGSTHLFCSTTCLSAFSHKPAPKKSCTMCKKDITTMKGTIVAQVDSSESFQEFCSTGCLGAYENKQNPPKSAIKTKCTVCGKLTEIRHEVSFKNVTHKICSDSCFNRYRMANGLIMNCCEQCGDYLPSRASANHFLLVDGQNKRFCCQNCVKDFKQAHGKLASCSSCKTIIKTGEVTQGLGPSGSMETYCSSACMNKSKVAPVTTILNSEPTCHFCKRSSLPQYQATLPEGNVLSFCSSQCVTKFQNATIQTATNGQAPLSTTNSIQLKCNYCRGSFSLKPETLEWEDKVYQFCSKVCCEDYKKLHCIVTFCHHCQEEKTLHETVQFSGVKRPFCSEGCKLLFKQEFTKRLGLKCVSCNHCSQLCKRGITRQLGGVTRDFCSEACAKKFHDWYHKAARCDCCKVQGNLTEAVQWRAEMKHFCDQHCLLRFYCQQNQPILVTQKGPENTSLEIGIQTQGTKLAMLNQAPVSYAAGGGMLKDVKNKAVLCKPLTLTKATYCKPHMQSKHLQTDADDGVKREYIPVPIPVPVFIPVPMNLYAQLTPTPVTLPVPVPVPIFLPTTLAGAEQIIQTISELKDEVPSDPCEADLLAMAHVIAEDQKPATGSGSPQLPVVPPCSQDVKCVKVKNEKGGGEEVKKEGSNSSSCEQEEEEQEGEEQEGEEQEGEEQEGEEQEEEEQQQQEEEKYEPDLDLEKDFPLASGQQAVQDGVKEEKGPSVPAEKETPGPRPRTRGLKRRAVEAEASTRSPPPPGGSPASCCSLPLKARYGLNAWTRWALASKEPSANGNRKDNPKRALARSSLFSLSVPELNQALARFVSEVRRPNGEHYAPDSLLYLCLGLQQHLQNRGRKDDLFSDPGYQSFGEELNKVLKAWKPSILPDGSHWSRVEEQSLWSCKVLGEHSPPALLRSLVYLNTKYLGLHTPEEHLRLSFSSLYAPDHTDPTTQQTSVCIRTPSRARENSLQAVSKKRKRGDEGGAPENDPDDASGSPAHCPLRKEECQLYELYRSKCPESLRSSSDLFYVLPEEPFSPDRPLWFSSAPLGRRALELLLPRVLLVKEVSRETRPPEEERGGEEE
ncbi:zinc finger MYM-type protein 2 isoform X2 [Osmerus mordax]|uniref:zinc finger MYM-type protein 2 isoform X2 n=1 Tax=Osmerus mordax TaxID=8014 RepID=UPI00350F20CC